MHLVARYYDLISWSELLSSNLTSVAHKLSGEDHLDSTCQSIRLTHIVVLHLVRSRPPPPAHMMPTPETSDISDPSSNSEGASTDVDTDTDVTDTTSEAKTELGYSVDPGISQATVTPANIHEDGSDDGIGSPTLIPRRGPQNGHSDDIQPPGLEDAIAELDLRDALGLNESGNELGRMWSHGSSAFGSSEGGSDWEAMGDSLELPPAPPGGHSTSNGWTMAGHDDASSEADGPANGQSRALPRREAPATAASRSRGNGARMTWEDRPTFFEYLYGE